MSTPFGLPDFSSLAYPEVGPLMFDVFLSWQGGAEVERITGLECA
jgi:hypothetical protein